MRITNQMTTNRMILNINRNMNSVNDLYTQLTSGKKIQVPSDNPIIASRALKFRTSISETEQYIKNVKQGLSWMDITEQAMKNMTESLISIKELCTEGASDNYNIDNKQTFATQLQSFLEQMESEMNVTYTGRYVFSGYRTDKPPVITSDNPAAVYEIDQSLSPSDVEKAKVYVKDPATLEVTVTEVNKLKLPYTDVEMHQLDPLATPVPPATSIPQLEIFDSNGNSVGYIDLISVPSTNTNPEAYNPGATEAYYIQDTGEIILGKDALDKINANANGRIDMSYTKTGLKKGELNPEVYFDCTDITDPANPKVYSASGQQIQYEFGVNTRVTVNSQAKDSLTASLYGDLRSMLQLVNGISITPREQLADYYSSKGYSGDDLTAKVDEHISAEKQKYNGILHDAFSNMLGIVEKHTSQVSKEYTQLGSQMNRLELIQSRLQQDKLSYSELMSDNENVDYDEAILNLNAANYVYQIALQVGGNIMQTSLADFIR